MEFSCKGMPERRRQGAWGATRQVCPIADSRLSAETRREQILEVAETLFIERGFEGVAMAEVAQALGTSRPTVYSYFTCTEDTEEMWRTLLDACSALLWEPLGSLLHSGGGPPFQLQRDRFLTRLAERIAPTPPAQDGGLSGALEAVTLLLVAAAVQALRHPGHNSQVQARVLGQFITGGLRP